MGFGEEVSEKFEFVASEVEEQNLEFHGHYPCGALRVRPKLYRKIQFKKNSK